MFINSLGLSSENRHSRKNIFNVKAIEDIYMVDNEASKAQRARIDDMNRDINLNIDIIDVFAQKKSRKLDFLL